jgi:hypothetical protein
MVAQRLIIALVQFRFRYHNRVMKIGRRLSTLLVVVALAFAVPERGRAEWVHSGLDSLSFPLGG